MYKLRLFLQDKIKLLDPEPWTTWPENHELGHPNSQNYD